MSDTPRNIPPHKPSQLGENGKPYTPDQHEIGARFVCAYCGDRMIEPAGRFVLENGDELVLESGEWSLWRDGELVRYMNRFEEMFIRAAFRSAQAGKASVCKHGTLESATHCAACDSDLVAASQKEDK